VEEERIVLPFGSDGSASPIKQVGNHTVLINFGGAELAQSVQASDFGGAQQVRKAAVEAVAEEADGEAAPAEAEVEEVQIPAGKLHSELVRLRIAVSQR
jgi:hypothetical protein